MSVARPKNVAASVRQRLLNLAQANKEPFDLILVRYALERLLYRLSVSEFRERFVLKGALLFMVWGHSDHRPTRDADLLAFGPDDAEHNQSVFRQVGAMAFDDGITYDPGSVAIEQIAEDKAYAGLRVRLSAELAGARIPVQFDIGFGDAVTPAAESVKYPTLLEFPPPVLRAYPVYTVIAEKFHAIVVLGMENSRMKDFHDLWTIGGRFDLEGAVLQKAISATFQRRKTTLPAGTPLPLTPEFASDRVKLSQWNGFVRKSRLKDTPSLREIQEAIAGLVMAVVTAIREGKPFDLGWRPGGPWRKKAKTGH